MRDGRDAEIDRMTLEIERLTRERDEFVIKLAGALSCSNNPESVLAAVDRIIFVSERLASERDEARALLAESLGVIPDGGSFAMDYRWKVDKLLDEQSATADDGALHDTRNPNVLRQQRGW